MGPLPISVTITNKITTIVAGGSAVTFNASVQNDATNSGATWTLTAGGAACSPTCGALSAATATSVTYTPPAALPAAPNNAPTVTATSMKDGTKSDNDAFTITAPAIIVTITNKITTIVAGGSAVTFNATVQNDPAAKGVTWALLEPGGAACPIGCGVLSGNTATSVTYTPPSGDFGAPFDTPVLVATSASDTSKSDKDSFTVVALSVTITNKVKSVQAGTAAITFHARVLNDPTNSGVLWNLTDINGACSPACGTLSNATATTVTYTPPATVPALPVSQPDLNASTVHGSAFDDDTFTIISSAVSSCAGTPTGYESRLKGQYAFVATGGGATSLAASFAPDGTGKITNLGGGIGGEVDFNNGINVVHTTVNSTGSLYAVGADPTGAGDLGCLQTLTSDGSTTIYRFSLAAPTGAVATKGKIIEYDDQTGNGTGVRLSGVLLQQDPTAFASGDTSHLQTNYAFGVSGISSGGIAVAGSWVLAPASGQLTKIVFDSNIDGLVQSDVTTSTGAITGVSAKTGRGLLTFSSTAATFGTTGIAVYIVNANELFLTSLDPNTEILNGGSPGLTFSGRAIVSGTNFTSASLSGNFIFHLTGVTTCTGPSCAAVALGVVSLTPTNASSGTSSGTLQGYDVQQGMVSLSLNSGTYTVDATTGRVTLGPGGLAPLPVVYLAAPVANTEDITAFLVGTDPSSEFGLVEPGAASSVTTSSLAGNYFFGDEQPSDTTVVDRVGVVKVSSAGAANGTEDDSSTTGIASKAVSYTVAIDNANGPGTGNVGTNSFAVTNGTKLFFFTAGGAPASITVVEHQ